MLWRVDLRHPKSNTVTELQIVQFPCLSDNYGFLLHDPAAGLTAAIDTPDAEAIDAELDRRDWRLTHILNTHHHADHAGGNLRLKERHGCLVVGPRADAARIPGIDVGVGEGELVDFGGRRIEVFETPGHTRGHVVYFVPEARAAFVGDTLFAMGCGRLFEGSPEQMWGSLQKILRWPDDTEIYCAHEYTLANARFAVTVEPQNQDLVSRLAEVEAMRERGQPTVPTRLGAEKATNPFLRPSSSDIQAALGLADADEVSVFARVRALKDRF
jgi:hydroxyacylglutathione hydrolase